MRNLLWQAGNDRASDRSASRVTLLSPRAVPSGHGFSASMAAVSRFSSCFPVPSTNSA